MIFICWFNSLSAVRLLKDSQTQEEARGCGAVLLKNVLCSFKYSCSNSFSNHMAIKKKFKLEVLHTNRGRKKNFLQILNYTAAAAASHTLHLLWGKSGSSVGQNTVWVEERQEVFFIFTVLPPSVLLLFCLFLSALLRSQEWF